MSAEPELARAFAPYVPIAELDNVLSISRNRRMPIFLRRNLSYSATHRSQWLMQRRTTHRINMKLQCLSAPRNYDTAISVVVAICAVVVEPHGEEALVPISACVANVSVDSHAAWSNQQPPASLETQGTSLPTGGPPGSLTTLRLPISLPDGCLRTDMVIVVLNKWDPSLTALLGHKMRGEAKASRRIHCYGAGREVTCTVRAHSLFQWFRPEDDFIMHGSISFAEKLVADSLHARTGVMELQPGALEIRIAGAGDETPARFALKIGDIGDATPILRYAVAVESLGRTTPRFVGAPLRGPVHAPPVARNSLSSSKNITNETTHPSSNSVLVTFCSWDGAYRTATRTPAFICPFDSCGMRCRDSFTALQQHLVACHPYLEYYFSTSEAEGEEVWVRCRPEWFAPDGTFLPSDADMNGVGEHPLSHLLCKSWMWMTFTYHCPSSQRGLRMREGSRAPKDARELQREQQAAKYANWAWLDELVTAARLTGPGAEKVSAGSQMDRTSDFSKALREERRVKVTVDRVIGEAHEGPRQRPIVKRRKPLRLLTSAGLPKFYHSRTCVAMSTAELSHGEDSDDAKQDIDEWKRESANRLEEQAHLCPEERDFMLAWNLFVHQNPIHGDAEVAAACKAFAKAHSRLLSDAAGSFRRCFTVHLINLWKFRLVSPSEVLAAVL